MVVFINNLFVGLRNTAEFIAKEVNTYMATATARRKYLVEVALRLPLIFIVHFLFVLGPYSDYTIVELVTCLFRYFSKFLFISYKFVKGFLAITFFLLLIISS